jgi:S1-C subfamily serine protease
VRRRSSLWRISPVVAALIVSGCGGSSKPPKPKGPQKLTEQQLIASSSPSVVRIQGATGGGSGFVIDAAQQLVLTNAHVVVGNSALKAQVGNDTSTSTPAQVVAASPCDDLAVVKLVDHVPGLKGLQAASSSTVQPGDQVTVLGFPASAQSGPGAAGLVGQSSTVVSNTGTVSQAAVQVNTDPHSANYDPSSPAYQSTIVHQAPVNPGNSGGPLLNQFGRVIGINTLGGSQTQGQYYSISMDYANRLLPDLKAGHSHGLVGWQLTQLSADNPSLTQALQTLYGGDNYGHVTQLSALTADFLKANPPTTGMYDQADQPGSPAANASVSGYLIYKIDHQPVHTFQDICDHVNSASPGQTIHLSTYNIDGTTDVTKLSALEQANHQNPNWGTDLKIPSN